ncbi:hypothetical protein FRB90_006383, partial [Tulasnella sp. 427]
MPASRSTSSATSNDLPSSKAPDMTVDQSETANLAKPDANPMGPATTSISGSEKAQQHDDVEFPPTTLHDASAIEDDEIQPVSHPVRPQQASAENTSILVPVGCTSQDEKL